MDILRDLSGLPVGTFLQGAREETSFKKQWLFRLNSTSNKRDSINKQVSRKEKAEIEKKEEEWYYTGKSWKYLIFTDKHILFLLLLIE